MNVRGVSAVLNAAAEILTVDRISKRVFNGPSRAAADTADTPKSQGSRIFWKKEGQISPADLGQRVSVHSPQTYLHVSPFLSLMSTGVPCMWGRAEYYCQDLPRRSEGRIFVLKC